MDDRSVVGLVLRVLRELQQMKLLDKMVGAIGEIAHRLLPSRRWQQAAA